MTRPLESIGESGECDDDGDLFDAYTFACLPASRAANVRAENEQTTSSGKAGEVDVVVVAAAAAAVANLTILMLSLAVVIAL